MSSMGLRLAQMDSKGPLRTACLGLPASHTLSPQSSQELDTLANCLILCAGTRAKG